MSSLAVSSPDSAAEPGLLAAAVGRDLAVHSATWVVADRGRTVGAVFGTVTQDEAAALVARLRASDDPGATAADLPWAAVALRDNGTVATASSMMLRSGLFTASSERLAEGGRSTSAAWAVGTDPVQVARLSGRGLVPDMGFMRSFLLLDVDAEAAPFAGVRRWPSGQTLTRARDGAVASAQWCGPSTLPAPSRSGPSVPDDYLDAFDRVTAGLVERSGPVVTTLSGGLDSAFMVASLVRAVGGRAPIAAYCQTPLPQAGAVTEGAWDPDDLPFAQAVAASFGGAVRLEPIRVDPRRHPLDVAAEVSRARGWPVAAVSNVAWLQAFGDLANAAGSSLRFFGTHGNASFSDPHAYAAEYYLRSGRPWRVLALAAPSMEHGLSRRGAFKRRVVAPLRAPRQADRGGAWQRSARLGIRPDPGAPSPAPQRDSYVRWLTGRLGGLAGAINPLFAAGTLVADPFASRTMIELAASIEPSEWQRGRFERALARRLSEGRVPDEVRLRRTRGGQGRDIGYLVRRNPDRLLDSIASTPAEVWARLGVDRARLRLTADEILAAETAPAHGWVEDVLRVAALGEYVTSLGE